MGFLPANIQLAMSFRSRLGVIHTTQEGQTDRQTYRQTDNGHQCLCRHLMGAGINKDTPGTESRGQGKD